MAHYVKNADLTAELRKSKAAGELTPTCVTMFLRMIKESTKILKYQNYDDREDCMSEAMMDILKYWKKFDPDHPKANAFAYFTEAIKKGMAKGWRKLHPIKTALEVPISSLDFLTSDF